MRSLQRFLAVLPLLLLIAGSARATDVATPQSANEIMVAVKNQQHSDDASFEAKMTLINSQDKRRERQFSYFVRTDVQDNRKLLIRFSAPADIEGTGFLAWERSDGEEDRWLYLPALRRTRRIASSDKTDSFVGSEFTYEDLEDENLSAYEYSLLASERLGGVDAWIIEAVPANSERARDSAYSKRQIWISKERYVELQVKYFDKDGAYAKLLQLGNIQQVPDSDKWRPHRMTMSDVQKGSRTLLEISEWRVNQGIPNDFFTERYLRRGR